MAVCIVFAINAGALAGLSLLIIVAVILHNLTGLLAAYFIARACGQDEASARTISIEVGTQNSGMAAALAVQHFSALAAIPSTLFGITQNIIGSCLAGYWSKKPTDGKTR